MAISNRRTVVRNYGSLNKGGSKVITSFNKDGVTSIKTLRGSVNNKSGGMDNQYTTNIYTPDKPLKTTNASKPRKTDSSSNGGDGSELLLGILFIVFLGVFWLIWKGCVWLYEAIFE